MMVTPCLVLGGICPVETRSCRYEDFARALADETRQAILDLLRADELRVTDIEAHFRVSQPTISYHLGILRRAGIVAARREGKQVYYRINRCCLEKCTQRLLKPFMSEER